MLQGMVNQQQYKLRLNLHYKQDKFPFDAVHRTAFKFIMPDKKCRQYLRNHT